MFASLGLRVSGSRLRGFRVSGSRLLGATWTLQKLPCFQDFFSGSHNSEKLGSFGSR